MNLTILQLVDYNNKTANTNVQEMATPISLREGNPTVRQYETSSKPT